MKILDTTTQVNHDSGLSQHHDNAVEAMSPMALALVELQETSGSALIETLEEMGMALGGRIKEHQRTDAKERDILRQQALLKLVQRIQQQGGITARPLPQARSDNLGQQILSVAARLLAQHSDSKKRKTLGEQLAGLLSRQGWEVALFGQLELGAVDKGVLAQINRLFQRAMDEENVSVFAWFQRIIDWPDRRRRVRVLLRMMAFELTACATSAGQQRLAATLVRLRRLLLFLGLEKECQRTETACEMSAGTLLPLLIEMTNESWLFGEWLAPRLVERVASDRLYNRLLQHLDALFTMMPDRCFHDDEQREQILTVLREMKGVRAIT